MKEILVAPARARTWRETAHLLLGAPLGALTVVSMLLLAYGVVGAITIVGLPVLAVLLHVPRLLAGLERWRARTLLRMPVPALPAPGRRPGVVGYVRSQLTDRAAWRLLPQLLVGGPLEIAQAALVIGLWGESLALLTWPVTRLFLSQPVDPITVADRTVDPGSGGGPYLLAALGLVGVLATPWAVRGLGAVDRWRLGHLLRPAAADPTSAMARRRDQAVQQADAQLRKLERDLHDGAQARIVALALELGRVRDELPPGQADTPQAARLAAAHEQAKIALSELRDLARGIYPAVLTDSGLDGALPALAERTPMPLTIDVSLKRRPAPLIEATLYFCASELVTNAIKHSRGSSLALTVRRAGSAVVLTVTDNGCGGAVARPGGGLAGLVDRAQSIGGDLLLASPDGGPTTVTVEVPCEW